MNTIRFVRLATYVVCLALLVCIAFWIKPQYAPSFPPLETWSMILGYLAYGCIGVTLLLGPIRAWLPARWAALSGYLRRDMGILAGLAALLHVVLVFILFSGKPRLMLINGGHDAPNSIYSMFFHAYASEGGFPYPNLSIIGIANYLGLTAFVMLLGLWLTSSNKAVNWLGTPAWKRLHMSNPFLFILVAFHALIYIQSIKGHPHSLADILWLAAAVLVVRGVSFVQKLRERQK